MGIKEYCSRIEAILVHVGESNWLNSFRNFISELEEHEDTTVYRKIISIYGGAGSFSDLVLYKNGVLCIDENNELERLRNGLYNKIGEQWT